jgi:hypothetical protein
MRTVVRLGATLDAMATSPKPATLTQPSGAPAWEAIPGGSSWQRRIARSLPPRSGSWLSVPAATTVEIASSHVVMMSHARAVTKVIERAANATS